MNFCYDNVWKKWDGEAVDQNTSTQFNVLKMHLHYEDHCTCKPTRVNVLQVSKNVFCFVYTEWGNKNFTLTKMLVTYLIVRFLVIIFYVGEVKSWPLTALKFLNCDCSYIQQNGGLVCQPVVQNDFAATQWKTSVTKCGPNCQKRFQLHPTNAELSLKTKLTIN